MSHGPDLARAAWFKSSLSSSEGGECVEVAHVGDATAVRDSKDPDGPVLLFTQAEWAAFVGGVHRREFDR